MGLGRGRSEVMEERRGMQLMRVCHSDALRHEVSAKPSGPAGRHAHLKGSGAVAEVRGVVDAQKKHRVTVLLFIKLHD